MDEKLRRDLTVILAGVKDNLVDSVVHRLRYSINYENIIKDIEQAFLDAGYYKPELCIDPQSGDISIIDQDGLGRCWRANERPEQRYGELEEGY